MMVTIGFGVLFIQEQKLNFGIQLIGEQPGRKILQPLFLFPLMIFPLKLIPQMPLSFIPMAMILKANQPPHIQEQVLAGGVQ